MQLCAHITDSAGPCYGRDEWCLGGELGSRLPKPAMSDGCQRGVVRHYRIDSGALPRRLAKSFRRSCC